MITLMVGVVIGLPIGIGMHRAYTRQLWRAERAIRRRAQGR